MNKIKKFQSVLLILVILAGIISLAGCGSSSAKKVKNCDIIHEPEFGGIYIKKTIEQFNALGYEYGDSVDIEFSNGYKLTAIPYYNGYYTKNGEPLLIAYPGYDYIKAAINNGDDLWVVAGLEEDMTATITLNEQKKFIDIQQARDIHYEDDRSLYDSDEIFANFRSIKSYRIKENTIYRSASPCDNQHNRAVYVDKLMKEACVKFILNLSDNDEKIEKYMSADDFDCPYFAELYKKGSVKPIALNMNYGSQEFKEKIAAGLTEMSKSKGPYLIHCTEGKDRTGFVCMLLEALVGTGYKEIVKDYMITYSNYYGITKETDAEKYDIIVDNLLRPMIQSIVGDDEIDIETTELTNFAKDFLLQGGMKQQDIDALINNIKSSKA